MFGLRIVTQRQNLQVCAAQKLKGKVTSTDMQSTVTVTAER